jgi:hypothetical protein
LYALALKLNAKVRAARAWRCNSACLRRRPQQTRQAGLVAFGQVRYRRLRKSTQQLKMLFALSNRWMAQRRLLDEGA